MPVSVALHLAERPRNRSVEARRAARQAKLERERLIVDFLNRGVSVAEIAQRIGVTEKRMRALVKEILSRRMPAALEDYVSLQASRLNEALLVAYGAMSDKNLKAVALVVRIVRELDRYHGFVAGNRRPHRDPGPVEAEGEERPEQVCDPLLREAGKSLPPGEDPGVAGDPRTMIRGRRIGYGKQECDGGNRLSWSCEPASVEAVGHTPSVAFGDTFPGGAGEGEAHPAAPPAIRPAVAPRALENMESAPENVALPNAYEAAPLQPENVHSVRADDGEAEAFNGAFPPAAEPPPSDPAPTTLCVGAEMAPQASENTDSAPGNGGTPAANEPSQEPFPPGDAFAPGAASPDKAPPPANPIEQQPMEMEGVHICGPGPRPRGPGELQTDENPVSPQRRGGLCRPGLAQLPFFRTDF